MMCGEQVNETVSLILSMYDIHAVPHKAYLKSKSHYNHDHQDCEWSLWQSGGGETEIHRDAAPKP